MTEFLETLRYRNEPLFYFGLLCLLFALFCAVQTRYSDIQVMGVNAWFKPLKFALSTFLFAWAMAWYAYYLEEPGVVKIYNWAIIITLGFEIVYIAMQAARGQLSHYNQSSPMYAGLYSLMALAATVATLWTAYLGMLFFQKDFPQLPDYYVWSIRIGIVLFVIFSLEGFVMGSKMSHTIGGPQGGPGIPLLNWSTQYGDARIAHFIGMHALQILPVLSFYALKNVKATLVLGLVYGLLALFVLIQSLQGKALFKG